jgi:hypothetical protein
MKPDPVWEEVLVVDNNKLEVFCVVVDKFAGVVSISSFLLQESNIKPKRHKILNVFLVINLIIRAVF